MNKELQAQTAYDSSKTDARLPSANLAQNPVLNEVFFSVHSYSIIDMDDADKWAHWSNGLKMIITKNGLTIKLDADEIKQLVKTLPRTIGGSY